MVHAACFKGYADAWSCEFRIKNSVFQGLSFWSGISPLRSYSQQHSRSPWKGILGCIAEWFWEAKHSSFRRHADRGVVLRSWAVQNVKSPQLGDRMTLGGNKCDLKLTDGASTAGGGNTDLPRNNCVIHKLFKITEVHLLECLRDTYKVRDAHRKWREVAGKEQARA